MAQQGGTGEGKRALFEREALPHVNALYSAALRLARNPDDAQDLLQETMLRAYRFFGQYTPGTNCRAWLLTILYNNFRNGFRTAGREQPAARPEDFDRELDNRTFRDDPARDNPEALLLDSVMDHEVRHALESIPDDFRAALIMVDIEDLDYTEVARVLAIPIGTVKSRISRGRQLMRTALARFARARGLTR